MKNIFFFVMAVIAASAFFTGCEKEENDFARDRVRGTEVVDTLPIHDTTLVYRDTTVYIYDTITDTVTEVREVVIPVHDTVTVPGEDHTYTLRLRQWHNRWLGVNAGYLVGEDSVVLSKFEGGQLIQTWRTTATHRGTATLDCGTAAYPTTVIGDSCWLAPYGAGLFKGFMAGNQVSLTLGNQAIVAPVMIDGFDWSPYLSAHQALGQRVRFDADGNARGFAIDADGRAAGFVTAPYTTTNPEDTSRRLISADTAYTHLSTNPTGVWSSVASTLTWSCTNRRTITRHYNRAPLTETNDYNFSIGFPYQVSVTGSAVAAMLGSTVTITSSGVASFTAGGYTLVVTLTALPRTCVLNPIPLPCQHQLTTATLASNGSGGYKVVVHGTLEGTATTGDVPVTATPRQEVSRDTVWTNTCGTVTSTTRNGSNHTINHTIVRTGTETIHFNIAPLTETHTVSETTHYVSSYTVSGSALTTAQGTNANFAGNSVTIGGATLTITPGSQPWCTLTYTSATLTSAGFVVTFTYNGQTGTVTIPVPWATPDPIFDDAIWGFITDSYPTNLTTSPEEWVHIFRQHGSGASATYTWYYAPLQSGLTSTMFTSVSISATQFASLQTAITAGRGLAKVYHHSDGGVTFELGTTKGIQQSDGRWKVKYYDIDGNLENMIEFSASTFSSYYGRNPIRGVMDPSTHTLTNGTITVQVF